MRTEHIFDLTDDHSLHRCLEPDMPGSYWILDCEGDPRLHIPDELVDGLVDEPAFAGPLLAWVMERIRYNEQKAYDTGYQYGLGNGRREVRNALGFDTLDRIADALERGLPQQS